MENAETTNIVKSLKLKWLKDIVSLKKKEMKKSKKRYMMNTKLVSQTVLKAVN